MVGLDQAIEAHKRGALDQAVPMYRAYLQTQPQNPDALALLGVALAESGSYYEGVASIERAVLLDPKAGLFQAYLGDAHRLAGVWDKACAAYEKAAVGCPGYAPLFFFYGLCLNQCERHGEAVVAYERAFALDPARLEALDNLALTYQILGRFEQALESYHRLLLASGQAVDEATLLQGDEERLGSWHHHLALLELRMGDYRHGFARYRSRFAKRPRPVMEMPLWRGEDLNGKSILLVPEQGHGDTIMLARFAPMLREKGATIYMKLPDPLDPLFEEWDGADVLLSPSDPMPRMDYYATFFDLPHRLGIDVTTVPQKVPYISVIDPDQALFFRQITGEPLTLVGRQKIGVCWAGNPAYGTNALRSIPLSVFRPLFDVNGKSFYSLTREERAPLCDHVKDCGLSLHSFDDTARVIQCMDLVIACDTAVAHLAGAMGKPVWVLLPYDSDWRWGIDGQDSLWYPTMRLFRQKTRGDWDTVIDEVTSALRAFGEQG